MLSTRLHSLASWLKENAVEPLLRIQRRSGYPLLLHLSHDEDAQVQARRAVQCDWTNTNLAVIRVPDENLDEHIEQGVLARVALLDQKAGGLPIEASSSGRENSLARACIETVGLIRGYELFNKLGGIKKYYLPDVAQQHINVLIIGLLQRNPVICYAPMPKMASLLFRSGLSDGEKADISALDSMLPECKEILAQIHSLNYPEACDLLYNWIADGLPEVTWIQADNRSARVIRPNVRVLGVVRDGTLATDSVNSKGFALHPVALQELVEFTRRRPILNDNHDLSVPPLGVFLSVCYYCRHLHGDADPDPVSHAVHVKVAAWSEEGDKKLRLPTFGFSIGFHYQGELHHEETAAST